MKKLAVIFPGVGYTCTKPLLYYTASMAAERGYEIIRLDYGQDIHTFHGRTPAELEPIIKLAIKRTLPQLENVPFSEYDDIIFISKSIGTTIACQLETALQLKGKVHQCCPPHCPRMCPARGWLSWMPVSASPAAC